MLKWYLIRSEFFLNKQHKPTRLWCQCSRLAPGWCLFLSQPGY